LSQSDPYNRMVIFRQKTTLDETFLMAAVGAKEDVKSNLILGCSSVKPSRPWLSIKNPILYQAIYRSFRV
jgi:hypothetical protein